MFRHSLFGIGMLRVYGLGVVRIDKSTFSHGSVLSFFVLMGGTVSILVLTVQDQRNPMCSNLFFLFFLLADALLSYRMCQIIINNLGVVNGEGKMCQAPREGMVSEGNSHGTRNTQPLQVPSTVFLLLTPDRLTICGTVCICYCNV